MEKNQAPILVIEDEEMLRINICEIIGHYRYPVTGTGAGEAGVQLASELKPSLIICDIMLPGIDGYEVLSRIRNNPQLHCVPFIFLSAKSARQDIRAGMEKGADDFITKPFSRTELLSSIRARFDRFNELCIGTLLYNGLRQTDSVSLANLTKAECRILKEVAQGLTTMQIADKLCVSKKTVENHRTNISRKLDLSGPNSLIQFAFYLKERTG